LNQQRTVQEWLSYNYQTEQDRYQTTQERLSNDYRTVVDQIRNTYERFNRFVDTGRQGMAIERR